MLGPWFSTKIEVMQGPVGTGPSPVAVCALAGGRGKAPRINT